MQKQTTVLVVDDCPIMRALLTEIINQDPELIVIGSAKDPLIAREKIKQLNPHVITLDVEMPNMDGLTFLEKLMTLRPTPTIMVSTLTGKGTEATIAALEIGAVECVAKPILQNNADVSQFADELCQKIRMAANARLRNTSKTATIPRKISYILSHKAPQIIGIGASTGGVEALGAIIPYLPRETPPIVVTQHMPAGFTASFAKRLSSQSMMEVVEAQEGLLLQHGMAVIACGGKHLEIKKKAGKYICHLQDGENVSGHKPSVDVLFTSLAICAGSEAIGIILTGMGKDGAEGLLAMKHAGAYTIGQSEYSCTVYGMPKQAYQLGAVTEMKDLSVIAELLLQRCFQ
jgi:two-component system, chemotaxis family, protein-glutamate methylesterase/glutaminase